MNSEILKVEQQGYIVTITINRPEKLNALNPEIHAGIVRHIDRMAEEGRVRCVVIKGQGERAFSAGDDLGRRPGSPMPELDPNKPPEMQWPVRTTRHAIFDAPFPVIAMIRGYCIGGGLFLASQCDMRVASEDSQFSTATSKLGFVDEYERIQLYVDLLGPSFSKELFCTGRRISAQKALAMGLINDVVPASELEGVAYGLAEELANSAPLSVSGQKRIINTLVRRRFEGSALTPEDIDMFKELAQAARASEDAKEGRLAFQQKRKPVFQGR